MTSSITYNSSSKHSRQPDANTLIPLNDLSRRPESDSFLCAQSRHSGSPPSEFSDWSDTGDLAEQLFGTEDPLRKQLGDADGELVDAFSRSRRRDKTPRYQLQVDDYDEKDTHCGCAIEDIQIPNPRPRHISSVEHKLAAMMSGGERQMHGLTGHSLIYFTSVFVSLGVFLFGYDQGVMSGIITGPYFKTYFNDPSPAEIVSSRMTTLNTVSNCS